MTTTTSGAKRPATTSERVAKSQARAVKSGARLIRALIPAEAAQALADLQAAGYADSATGCIARALIEASEAPNVRAALAGIARRSGGA